MFDDVSTTFYHNIVAAYAEYVEQKKSSSAGRGRHLRTAIAAATALYHFREHLPESLRKSVEKLADTSPDYALVRGVANAAKHKRVTRSQSLVAGAEDINEVTVIVRYSDADGEYSHSETKILVKCTDGVTRWLDPAITRTLNLWGTMLKEAGLCGYTVRPEPEAPGYRHLSRQEARTSLNFEATRGLAFRQDFQFLRYDSDLRRAVEIDLTGGDIQLRIYKPPKHLLDFTMLHPEHGEVTASVSLTAEENAELHQIDSEAEREAFMERLFEAHQSEIELEVREQLKRGNILLPRQ